MENVKPEFRLRLDKGGPKAIAMYSYQDGVETGISIEYPSADVLRRQLTDLLIQTYQDYPVEYLSQGWMAK